MAKGMQISILGSSLVSAYWNGAATYYRGIIRALHERGHSVTFYEPDACDRQSHRDLDNPDYARSVVYPNSEAGVCEALHDAADADILIKASGIGVFDEFLERAVLDLRSPDRMVVYWDLDAAATLERLAMNPLDAFRGCLPEYDLVLTYGGGQRLIEAYESAGARRCVPIYNALDPTTHYPVLPDARFTGDFAFLGNRLPDREEHVEEFFFKPARQMYDCRFVLGGSGWDRFIPPLPHITYLHHIYTHDHNAFNCSPRAVLSISRDPASRYGYSPMARIFEAAGAGACIVTDAWQGLEAFLEPGRECLTAKNGDDVVRILRGLTAEESRRIGAAARNRVLDEHTYSHRARFLEQILAHAQLPQWEPAP